MKEILLSVDDEVHLWLSVLAERQNRSVESLVVAILTAAMPTSAESPLDLSRARAVALGMPDRDPP